jgi:hypothetical protein
MMASILTAGTPAPRFNLRVTPDQWLELDDVVSNPVILAFYPADWTPVCGDQLSLYNEIPPGFRKHGGELLGTSVDGVWCHEAYAAPPSALPMVRLKRPITPRAHVLGRPTLRSRSSNMATMGARIAGWPIRSWPGLSGISAVRSDSPSVIFPDAGSPQCRTGRRNR